MTDGILLAEIQRDRMLRRYDTLIIDEAHERSLNIDFILGYLAQLLPQRPDLKVIVTSATIDTARFAGHFAADGVDRAGDRGRPGGRTRSRSATGRSATSPTTTATRCRRSSTPSTSSTAKGPATCSCSCQRRARDPRHRRRPAPARAAATPRCCRCTPGCRRPSSTASSSRTAAGAIVLATNVAETSLTVPGVRYVVDAGTARISRYSRRLKVQRLPIEPVSQASANQRAGRCGRVAPGHLHPPVRRGRLRRPAGVHRAGDPAHQPGVGHPADDGDRARRRRRLPVRRAARRAPRSATATCCSRSSAAIEPDRRRRHRRRLTPIGRRLARLPVDPRLGRMVLEAERHGCVREVLVIAAALSIQDPRERPMRRAASRPTQLHRRFDVAAPTCCRSSPCGTTCATEQRQLSSNQFRKLCRAEYLNYLRVREWQDLFSQLRQVAGELGIRGPAIDGRPSRPRPPGGARRAAVAPRHAATATAREFRGARGATFVIAPGSVLAKQPPRWVMAAELVETNRLWARRVAAIQPEWAERVGAHLVKRVVRRAAVGPSRRAGPSPPRR